MSEILGDKLNIVYEGTLLEITPELLKKTIIKQNKEIERLKKELEKYKYSADELNEIERLNNIINGYDRGTYCKLINENRKMNNIIKEIREYIEENKVDLSWFMTTDKDLKLEGISNVVSTFRLLEILKKEDNNEIKSS